MDVDPPATDAGETSLLESELDVLIRHFDKESAKHKRIFRSCEALLLALGFLTTVTAASSIVLPDRFNDAIQFTLVVLAASTTATAGYAAMRRARDLWQLERSVHHRLPDIRLQVRWLKSHGQWDLANQERVLQRILELLGDSTEDWKASLKLQPDRSQRSAVSD